MLRFLMIAAAAMLGLTALPAAAQASRQIQCASANGGPKRCTLPQPILNAQLLRQLGNAPCVRGQSWGFDRGAVYVSYGCAGKFNVWTAAVTNPGYPGGGYPGGGYPGAGGGYPPAAGLVTCESWGYQPRRCAANTRGGVRLARVNGGNCVQGQSWGFDRDEIWVNGGCRAQFAVGGGGYPGGGFPGNGLPGGGYPGGGYPGGGGFPPGNIGGGNRTIACESWNYQNVRCAADVYNGAQLARVTGGSCIQNRTWGYDRGGIWVGGGCRAVFRLY